MGLIILLFRVKFRISTISFFSIHFFLKAFMAICIPQVLAHNRVSTFIFREQKIKVRPPQSASGTWDYRREPFRKAKATQIMVPKGESIFFFLICYRRHVLAFPKIDLKSVRWQIPLTFTDSSSESSQDSRVKSRWLKLWTYKYIFFILKMPFTNAGAAGPSVPLSFHPVCLSNL